MMGHVSWQGQLLEKGLEEGPFWLRSGGTSLAGRGNRMFKGPGSERAWQLGRLECRERGGA